MRVIDAIVVHCAATPPSMDIGAAEIRRWHMSPPRNWNDNGYHRVIRRDGTIERGRRDEIAGAHVVGHNARTLAVCLVGGVDDAGQPENNFTPAQFDSLRRVLLDWLRLHPRAEVKGHRDFPGVAKACPSFDVRSWFEANVTRYRGTAL